MSHTPAGVRLLFGMYLARLRPWQWRVGSLLLGLALGAVALISKQCAVADYGETINGDRDFERALTAVAPGGGAGVRVFHNLVVQPVRIAGDDGPRDVHVVTGRYVSAGGAVKQRCYVASLPYRPVRRDGRAEYASVRDYLDGLETQGVTYRYAWWNEPRWVVPTWTAGTVLGAGFLLPMLVNYLAYGSIRRPPEEKGIDLSKVRPTQSAAAPASVVDAGGWGGAAGDVADGLTTEAPAAVTPAPPPPVLTSTPLEVAAVEPGESHTYGAGPEDFYPTERKAPAERKAQPGRR